MDSEMQGETIHTLEEQNRGWFYGEGLKIELK